MAGVERYRRTGVVGVCLLLVAVVVAACGGGAESGTQTEERITDPAAVPSATPIQSANLFKIENNGAISAPDGSVGTPAVTSGTPPPSSGSTYEVQPGDTCGAIAAKFNITFDELRKSNRTINEGCTNIRPGDRLKIPSGGAGAATTPTPGTGGAQPTPPPSGREHVVADGESCYDIAGSYGVSLSELIELNGLDAECQTLQIGQTLKIP